ncbi:MAG: hypothetical protein P8I92_05975 [Schleiferiaceae bacterium]|nr:hypothetical protein [Schleiferiaceae bacterium]
MLYPDSAYEALDFNELKQMVSKFAISRNGRQAIVEMLPNPNQIEVEQKLAQGSELLELMNLGTNPPAVSKSEINEALPLLKIRNSVLDVGHFMAIRDQAHSYKEVYRFSQVNEEQIPSLATTYKAFPPEERIHKLIDVALEKNGQVKSNASTTLQGLRREISKKRISADKLFYKALKRYEKEGWLGETRESVSNNRRVLAVKAADKNKGRGAFHGSSAKNTLVFLEPSECLEINAEVGILLEEERREIRRILLNLTKEISPFRKEIEMTDKRLLALDILIAKTKFAKKEGACLPEITDDEIYLHKATNPVLKKTQSANNQKVVPLDIALSSNQRLVVISGPNAGGKSLALKTVGLFQLMLQCGMLIPTATDSKMRWFKRVTTDIGDAQSIENELSTYSGKLSKMREILNTSDSGSLCLVDEFGGGSDPDLGSALARVFLFEIHKSKAFGVFTTHFNNIKALAEELDGAGNANMAFDVKNLQPLYLLRQGTPGSSYTFEVAERSGISADIMAEAKKSLKSQTISVDNLIVGLQKQRTSLERTKEEVSKRLKELESLKVLNEKQIQKLEKKLLKTGEENAETNQQLIWGKRMEQWSKSWTKAKTQKLKKELQGRIIRALSERNQEINSSKKREETKKQKIERQEQEKLMQLPVYLGDKVRLLSGPGRQAGEIMDIRKDKFLISFGGVLTSWAGRKDFIHWGASTKQSPKLLKNQAGGRDKQNAKFVENKKDTASKAEIKNKQNGKRGRGPNNK